MTTQQPESYRQTASKALHDSRLRAALRNIQGGLGKGALAAWKALPTGMRDEAKAARMRTLSHLDETLAQLSAAVRARGGHVFFAADARQAREYCLSVAQRHAVRSVVKGKSMTSAEIGVDALLEEHGIEVVETDLGEYIIQLAEDRASHIIAPCIHMDRRQIAELFRDKLGIEYTEDPPALTRAARKALRAKLLGADMGISGCNIACAETGHIALVSNEGNIRVATTMPKIHVALMGMERVADTLRDHDMLLRLLTRGAAVQNLSTYVSFIGGPRQTGETDGPEEFHLVIIDNGRSRILADPRYREVLACIRCGACLNACPVYGRIGGHAYHSPYPGPIGAVVTPLLRGVNANADLCKGETLCGACRDICPVHNDLPRMLSELRHALAYGDSQWQTTPASKTERFGFQLWARAMRSRGTYNALLKAARFLQTPFLRDGVLRSIPVGPAARWTQTRDLPPIARESFGERWRRGGIIAQPMDHTSVARQPSSPCGTQTIPHISSETAAPGDFGYMAVLPRAPQRTLTERLALLDILRRAATPLNLVVHTVAGTSEATQCITDIAIVTETEWGGDKRVSMHSHPLLATLRLPEALKEHGIAVHCSAAADAPQTADEAALAQRSAVEAAYIGVTSAEWCVVDSATIALRTLPGRPRSTSLVPSVHVAVIRLEQLLATLPELYAEWSAEQQTGKPLPCSLTLISGPSKTADIEACMVHGAHGPRAMHLVVITGE